jgi:hypothetical protein
MNYKIIDAHMHPNFDDKDSLREAAEAGVDFTLNGLLKDFKKFNILKAVAIPSATEQSFVIDNEKIKKLVLEHPEVFIGACTITPLKYKHEDLIKIEEDIKKGIFKAIKLFPGYELFYPNQKECEPIYELAERNKVPVLFHTGDLTEANARLKYSHPLNVDDVAASFPNVNFVLCHLGNPWIMDAVEVLYKNKNAYADLSGFIAGKGDLIFKKYYKGRQKAMMEGIFYEITNVDKLMFATDYPLTNYEFYIKFIKKLKLNKKEFNKVFFENAAKLFNVKA